MPRRLGDKAPNANLSTQPAGKGASAATLPQPQNNPTRTAVFPVPDQCQLHGPAINTNKGNDEDEDMAEFEPTLPPGVSWNF